MVATPSPDEVRAQIGRLKASRAFAGSERLCALLTFVVEETLAGRGASLKEAVIGNEVYGRTPAYDPRIDSAVRVEARRLRRKLEEYYADEGLRDPVRVAMPSGQYAVVLTANGPDVAGVVAADGGMFRRGTGARAAILPFRALSRDPIDQSFADGLTDELIFVLSRSGGIQIASRAVTATGEARPADLAAELGVDALIQGTVRRFDGRVRVTVEMSSAEGFVVLSDRFEAPDDDLVDLEAKVAASLLNRIQLDNSRMRAREIGVGPGLLDAYADVVRGRQLIDQQTPESLLRAQALFARLAAIAPDYARAHAGIADCTADQFRLGLIDQEEARRRAFAAAETALAADPLSVEAHASRATVAAWIDYDRNAEACFRRSIELGDNARCRRVFGVFLTIFGRHDEAEAMFSTARRIEPFSGLGDIAETLCHFQSRRFGRLLDAFAARARELPAEARFHVALADVFAGDGRLADDIAPGLREDGVPPTLAVAAAEIDARRGRPAEAHRLLETPPQASRLALAMLALAVGDRTRALTDLAAAIAAREADRAWIRTDIRLDGLRGSAAFEALLSAYDQSLAP